MTFKDESPYYIAVVSGAHFTPADKIECNTCPLLGTAKSRTHQFAMGGFLGYSKGMVLRMRACKIWTLINSVCLKMYL